MVSPALPESIRQSPHNPTHQADFADLARGRDAAAAVTAQQWSFT
jgi:hypothetical protein